MAKPAKVSTTFLILDQTEYSSAIKQLEKDLKGLGAISRLMKRAVSVAAKKTAAFLADRFRQHVINDPNIKQAMTDLELRGALGLRKDTKVEDLIFKKSRAFFKVEINQNGSDGTVRFKNQTDLDKIASSIFYISKKTFLNPYSDTKVKKSTSQKINWFEWLLRPSTGNIQGFSVWPGVNGNEKLNPKLEPLKDTIKANIAKRSRSGTHTMLFGGSFSIKSWVKRKRDVDIDKEFIRTINDDARDYFRVALREQVLKYGAYKKGEISEGRAGPISQRASKEASPEAKASARELAEKIVEAAQRGEKTFMGKPIQDLLKIVSQIGGLRI
jgi:hypothetical protein